MSSKKPKTWNEKKFIIIENEKKLRPRCVFGLDSELIFLFSQSLEGKPIRTKFTQRRAVLKLKKCRTTKSKTISLYFIFHSFYCCGKTFLRIDSYERDLKSKKHAQRTSSIRKSLKTNLHNISSLFHSAIKVYRIIRLSSESKMDC